MNENQQLVSSALQANLERTAANVEIPEVYRPLLEVVEPHYGVAKRTRELLIELNHPFVNWDFVLKQLRSLSIGDFYEFNGHAEGARALGLLLEMYFSVIRSSAEVELRETAVRYLFDFLDTVLSKSNEHLERNATMFPDAIQTLAELSKSDSGFFKKSSTYLKSLLKSCVEHGVALPGEGLAGLLYRVFMATYDYWLAQPDPGTWEPGRDTGEGLDAYHAAVEPLTHASIASIRERLESLRSASPSGGVAVYLDMPDYFQIVNGYLLVADELERLAVFEGRQHLVKLQFLLNIVDVPALVDVHGSALIEVNRCVRLVFSGGQTEHLADFVRHVFSLLKRTTSSQHYRKTILTCITTIAREAFKQTNHPLVEVVLDEVIKFGFQYPMIAGSTAEWQIQVNPAHVPNIRSWIEIIGMRPRWTKRLLSALIINLKQGGVFVKDTDLLQKDISGLLNADIAAAYNLVKQLLRLFPIYFSEIGAEGELRDISTRLDELSFRNDLLIHFLRKQTHVESNSLLIDFIEDIFRFWQSSSKEHIERHLPDEVFSQIDPSGEYFEGLHRVFKSLFVRHHNDPRSFLPWDKARIQRQIQTIRHVPARDRERATLIIRLYQLLYKKYNVQPVDLLADLDTMMIFDAAKVRTLKRYLQKKNYYKSLGIILDFLGILKERVLSPEKTEYFENIYHKRHIAAGIPSMYGTYREEKFEAAGLSLRLESLAAILFENLVGSLNLKFVTKNTLARIHDYLWLYVRALDLEGIATEGLVSKLKYLTNALPVKQFSVDQYIDIFKFISKGIQNIIRDYYIDAHRPNLPIIIGQVLAAEAERQGRQTPEPDIEAMYQHSENFIRAAISGAFGLQQLDTFINRISTTLGAELEKFKDNKQILNLVMAYEPELVLTSIYRKDKKIDNQILIGNKGYFLKQLAALGFPVPPGFILTTEVFRSYDAVVGYKYIFKDISKRIYDEVVRLEKTLGKKFGDPKNPLLLSVRSGATISLPGMMHSFLNVGMNERIAAGLATRPGFAWAAWDSYRRFLQSWGMFQGLERNFFDTIIDTFKYRYGIPRKLHFQPDQMRQTALAYKQALEERGIRIPDSPPDQLRESILKVFASWYSDQARIYRHQMGLSEEWGTAVIVQAMMFGNLDENSGSGVIFTRNPRGLSPEVTPYGDFIFGVQGEDVVSGLVETYPVSERQRIAEKRQSPISLEASYPEIYRELARLAEFLVYEKGFNHQEIEFTFEKATADGLYILQTREMVQQETTKLKIFKDTPRLQDSLVGSGIGVSGGALAGRAVYAEDEIRQFRETEPQTPLILIRPDTVPEDVGILLQVDGILTARGGSTSHAAVTIPQLNKVGVVGFSKLKVYENEAYSMVDGRTINGGDFIAIDGWSGAVYLGQHEIESEGTYHTSI